MEHSTRIVEEACSLGNDLGSALHKNSDVVTEVSNSPGDRRGQRTVRGSSQIAKANQHGHGITRNQLRRRGQASGAQAVVRAMDKMLNSFSSRPPAPRAIRRREQMLKALPHLLDTMDRFVIDRATQPRHTATRRRNGVMRRPANPRLE